MQINTKKTNNSKNNMTYKMRMTIITIVLTATIE